MIAEDSQKREFWERLEQARRAKAAQGGTVGRAVSYRQVSVYLSPNKQDNHELMAVTSTN